MTVIAFVVIGACLLAAVYDRANRMIYFIVIVIVLGMWLGPYTPNEGIRCEGGGVYVPCPKDD